MIRKPDLRELRKTRHPDEDTSLTFGIALSIVAIIAIAGIDILFTNGALAGGFLFLSIGRFVYRVFTQGKVLGTAVKVSERNFPDIHFIAFEVREALGIRREIEFFVIADTRVASWSRRWPGRAQVILTSGLVEAMNLEHNRVQATWIAARSYGRAWSWWRRRKIMRLYFRFLLFFVPLRYFVLPYFRAVEFTGDQVGMAVVANLDETADVFHKLLAGANLAQQISFTGLIQQGEEMKHDWMARFFSTFNPRPALISRYLNLLAFSHWRFPAMFDEYISHFRAVSQLDLGSVLPKSWKGRKPIADEEPITGDD